MQYLAVDKGPITDTHALILPVEHYPSSVTALPGALKEMETLMESLGRAYASKGLVPIGFERCVSIGVYLPSKYLRSVYLPSVYLPSVYLPNVCSAGGTLAGV